MYGNKQVPKQGTLVTSNNVKFKITKVDNLNNLIKLEEVENKLAIKRYVTFNEFYRTYK